MTTPTPEQLAQAAVDAQTEITKADAKAGALLAAIGLPIAVLTAVLPGRDLPIAAAVIAAAGAAGLVTALIAALLVIRPRLGGRPAGSYLRWADATPTAIAGDIARTNKLSRIAVLSRIAARKQRMLRIAVDIAAGSLAALVAALLITLV